MDKIYLTKEICNYIKTTRISKGIPSYTIAYMCGKNASWMSRVENFKCTYIRKEIAEKLETLLDIIIVNEYIGKNEKLLQKIKELKEENRMLKELLITKWQVENEDIYFENNI
jgi:ribosome-binding protein aMBF1 (putative translation factor)